MDKNSVYKAVIHVRLLKRIKQCQSSSIYIGLTFNSIATSRGFPTELGNIPQKYLHYRMYRFLTWLSMWIFWWNYWALLSHCKKMLFSISTTKAHSVLGVGLSEGLLPWVPLFSFHVPVYIFDGCFQALAESLAKLRLMIDYAWNNKDADTYLTTTSESALFALSCMVKTAWEREDRSCTAVAATRRLAWPCNRRFWATSSVAA